MARVLAVEAQMKLDDRAAKEAKRAAEKAGRARAEQPVPPARRRKTTGSRTDENMARTRSLPKKTQSIAAPGSRVDDSREARAAMFNAPSHDINSHEMAEFFLEPYKERMKTDLLHALNPLSAAQHAASKLHRHHAHHVVVRVDFVRRILTQKKRTEVRLCEIPSYGKMVLATLGCCITDKNLAWCLQTADERG